MTSFITGVLIALIVLLNFNLYRLFKRQQDAIDMILEYHQVNYIFSKFQNDALELMLWKTMTDLYHSKAQAASMENYEMAEHYKNAIATIENMMNYYRQNLKEDVSSEH